MEEDVMKDISMMNHPKRKNGLMAIGFLAIAGILTIATRSQANTICPYAPQGGPAQVIAWLDQGSSDCWTGSSYETGTSWALGGVSTTPGNGRSVAAYAFWGLTHNPPSWNQGYGPYAIARAYSLNNVHVCDAIDYIGGDGMWAYNTSPCNDAAYVVVTAESVDPPR
jgi:hypothetical protein